MVTQQEQALWSNRFPVLQELGRALPVEEAGGLIGAAPARCLAHNLLGISHDL
jgi:hypothetical protein